MTYAMKIQEEREEAKKGEPRQLFIVSVNSCKQQDGQLRKQWEPWRFLKMNGSSTRQRLKGEVQSNTSYMTKEFGLG